MSPIYRIAHIIEASADCLAENGLRSISFFSRRFFKSARIKVGDIITFREDAANMILRSGCIYNLLGYAIYLYCCRRLLIISPGLRFEVEAE